MILVDTSAWIDFFRGGRLADDVEAAIDSNDAATCGPVLTELLRGFRSGAERRRVMPLVGVLHELAPPPDLWTAAGNLGFALARRGATVKTLDLLIAAYAIAHATPLLTSDGDFRLIASAGVGLSLA